MSTFILLAALASQITFSTSQQANVTTIIPQVTLADACECQVEVLSVRQGQGGQSTSRQKNTLFIPANQPIDLTRISLNIRSGGCGKNNRHRFRWKIASFITAVERTGKYALIIHKINDLIKWRRCTGKLC